MGAHCDLIPSKSEQWWHPSRMSIIGSTVKKSWATLRFFINSLQGVELLLSKTSPGFVKVFYFFFYSDTVIVCCVAGRMQDSNAALKRGNFNWKQQFHWWKTVQNKTRNQKLKLKHEKINQELRTRITWNTEGGNTADWGYDMTTDREKHRFKYRGRTTRGWETGGNTAGTHQT